MENPYKVWCYFAREHGLNGLQALLDSSDYDPLVVCTHRLRPESEDPARPVRPEYEVYKKMCEAHNIPLLVVDYKQDLAGVDGLFSQTSVDVIASISWRRLIPAWQIEQARFGGVNVHRGKLPDYAGAEPIKQAIQGGERDIAITAHELSEQIDTGKPLQTVTHPIGAVEGSIDVAVERLKKEVTPYFGSLLLDAIDGLLSRQ